MNNNKNFVFLSNATGGIASFQSNIINFLIKNNYNTYLIDKKYNQTQKYIKNKNNLHKLFKCDVFKNYLEVIKILKNLRIKNSKQNIFVISNTVIFSFYFPIIKIFFKKPKILLIHHSHIYNFNFTQIFFGFLSSLLGLITYRTIFVSNFTMRWWNKYFPFTRLSKKYLQYNLVSFPNKIRLNKQRKLHIGFVGRLEKEKGLKEFISVAKKIKNKKFKFYIFGEGSIKIIKSNLGKIKLYKWTKKEQIYKKINVLFVTSNIENCPFNVLEAKSYGIPTLTNSRGGINEIIKHNKDGILLDKKTTIKQIEKSFQTILLKYEFFRKNCIKNSYKFNIDKYSILIKNLN